jgi:hypothetical protein
MIKSRLIRIGWTDLNRSYLEWILRDYFVLENYNFKETYSKDCIFVISRAEYWHPSLVKYLDMGCKFIFANPWEAQPFFQEESFLPYLQNTLVILGSQNSLFFTWPNILNVPRWFWYNESLWYTCESKMQFQSYTPIRTNKKLFFMPINRSKTFRTKIVERFENILDQAVWSYAQRYGDGKHLPVREENPVARLGWDRQFEEWWYNDTYFSVVVETAVDSQLHADIKLDYMSSSELFVTEKTFKPIAFQHPFLICGMKGTLKFLKANGFETYDHIFDETYDNLDFFEDRLDIIYNNIKNFNESKYSDPLTNQKIQHNYNRFYDRSAVLAGVKQDLIEPMLEWINAE